MAQGGASPGADLSLPLVRHMILNNLRNINVKFRSEFGKMVICCDNRTYWRKEVFPYYKANRKVARKASGLNWNEIFAVLNTVRDEITEHFPYPVIDVVGAEADDVIATLSKWAFETPIPSTSGLFEETEQKVVIVSRDHDFQQLLRFPNVRLYNPIDRKWVTNKEPVDAVLMEHIICGDKDDGIPNFLSDDDTFVSDKRQKSIMKDKLAVWKYQSKDAVAPTPELQKNFERNDLLVNLLRVPDEVRIQIMEAYEEQRGRGLDRQAIKRYFIKNNMMVLFDTLPDF